MATPNMNLTLPVDHGSADIWDTVLDTIFGLIDAHDHTTGKGVKIPSAALNINADVSWASGGIYYALKDVLAVDFQPSAATAMTSYAGALFVNSADNELYWRTIAGTNVKMTAGNALNVAAFTGGIGGDYAAVGALASFDDATDRYLFQQQGSPRPWAGIALGNLDIYQQAASISNRVRQKSPAALAASYDMTWFTALPASAVGVSIDAGGQWAAGVSMAMNANANITLSGTGTYKHGTKTTAQAVHAFLCSTSAGTVNTGAGIPGVSLANNTITYIPLPPLPTHARIVNVSVWFASAADRNACTCELYRTSTADPALRAFTDTTITLTPSGTALAKATGINQTFTNAETYWVQVTNSTSTPAISAISVDWDVP